jgi:hypothetical protein
MKALIIYYDFASAAKANAALQFSGQYPDVSVQWNISPWRIDLLKFPPTAEEALADAADAHLIVFAGGHNESLPFWLQDWLEKWAQSRLVKDVALAVVREGNADESPNWAMPELAEFATRHGLHFIFDSQRMAGLPSVEGGLRESNPAQSPLSEAEIRDAHQRWNGGHERRRPSL